VRLGARLFRRRNDIISQTPFLSLLGDFQLHIVSSALFVSLLPQSDIVTQESSGERLVEERINE
jgi:hypothetical protein